MAQGANGKANDGEFGELSAVPIGTPPGSFSSSAVSSQADGLRAVWRRIEPLAHNYMTAPFGPTAGLGWSCAKWDLPVSCRSSSWLAPARLCQRS